MHTARIPFYRHIGVILTVLLLCRLVAMTIVPLNDTTEARYGEIARIMLETNNWVTPMHHYDDPFWAKPPLSTWISAFSMKYFGVNALAARLPSIPLSIGILWLIFGLSKRHSGEKIAYSAILILAGSLFFFLDAGTVMTDPALMLCTTLIIVAFWHALVNRSRRWGYAFFIGLGFGLLAKGPVALVLTGMPLFIWVWKRNQWRALWTQLPWITGSLLMLLIAVPWYVLAEIRTPGFLNYFLVGEHIHRFLQPGWDGDKYGFAHVAPIGMIWIYILIGTLPWSIAACSWFIPQAKTVRALWKDDHDGWISYLLLCTLIPLIFFTFARNIIYPYVFPSLPTFALLYAELFHRTHRKPKDHSWMLTLSLLVGLGFFLGSLLFIYQPTMFEKSQKLVINAWQNQHPSTKSNLVYWAHTTAYSAAFYSSGRAQATLDPHILCRLLSNQENNYVAVRSDEPTPIPTDIRLHLTPVATISMLKRQLTLYRSDIFHCAT